MAFSRIALGWGLVAVLFVVWDAVAQRVAPATSSPSLPARLTPATIESLLLTLFAGLWFGSLGSGGALILFLVVGLLMEVPSRLRHRGDQPIRWSGLLANLIRIEAAGLVLSIVLGGRIL